MLKGEKTVSMMGFKQEFGKGVVFHGSKKYCRELTC